MVSWGDQVYTEPGQVCRIPISRGEEERQAFDVSVTMGTVTEVRREFLSGWRLDNPGRRAAEEEDGRRGWKGSHRDGARGG